MSGNTQDHQERHAREREQRLRIADQVVGLLWEHIRPASVLDVGCGVGFWLKAFENRGVVDLCGIEGDWLDLKWVVANANFMKANLEKPFDLDRKFDLVMSIEVAEHIGKESASNFIKSLVAHGDLILFSAAIPGQGGQGHVNEQYLQYWIDRFARHGYRPFDLLRPSIWNDNTIFLHLRQNLVLFANEAAVQTYDHLRALTAIPVLMSVIHPEYYDRELIARRALKNSE